MAAIKRKSKKKWSASGLVEEEWGWFMLCTSIAADGG